MATVPLSVVVTTFDNARTLGACLRSVAFADEILVLDSFSRDATIAIARAAGAVVHQEAFRGYGPQKQRAIELARHRWVLLLDADEMLSDEAGAAIRDLLAAGPTRAGYTLPRQEQLFWRMSDRGVRMNRFLRLFDRERTRMGEVPVHAAPEVGGPVGRIDAPFFHFGETSVAVKVAKVNAYASGLVPWKRRTGRRARPWMMLLYPPFVFLRHWLFKRQFRNGWAGVIASVVMAFYAFLKHAGWYEAERFEREAGRGMPPGAPPVEPPTRGPA